MRVSGSGGLIAGLIEIQCFVELAKQLVVFGVELLCGSIVNG